MSNLQLFNQIAANVGFDCKNNTTIRVDSNSAKRITIDFEHFDLDDLDHEYLENLLKQMFATAKSLETSSLIEAITLEYNDTIKLKVTLDSDNQIEHNDDFFVDDLEEINDALNEISAADISKNEAIEDLQAKLTQIENILSSMPEKGLTSSDSQKVYLKQCVNSLDSAVNGISLTDFLENWD